MLAAALSARAAARPATPVILEPALDGQVVSGADVHMVTAPFSDPDGQGHRCSDWRIRSGDGEVWQAPCASGANALHIHLADGAFAGTHAGSRELEPDATYRLGVRHRDDSGEEATEWSEWAEREFRTAEALASRPMRVRDILDEPAPQWGASIPAGGSLRVEQIDGVSLLEIGPEGIVHHEPAASRSDLRVVVESRDGPWVIGESELRFEDENGRPETIYLPVIALNRSSVTFWVSWNGGTHYAVPEDTAPTFRYAARGAPAPWVAREPGFAVERVAEGFRLPVNLAFIPEPGSEPGSPFFYVTELYGTVKVVTRDGQVHDFATGLLGFDPGGLIPGSGEFGLAGIAVDPGSGDVFVTVVTRPDPSAGEVVPNILRLRPSPDGLSAESVETVKSFPGEGQAPSHQISNVTVGPDGMLYVHVGDSQVPEYARDLSTIRGKILRMTPAGEPAPGNPFLDAADGVTARDYVWALGFRNPFGGAWRVADGSLYAVENGPAVDRLARIVGGRDYGWDGSDASMRPGAIYNWDPAVAPVQIAFAERETHGGSGFPEEVLGSAFVTESGPTWAAAEQARGKRITRIRIRDGRIVGAPSPLVEYNGTGRATAAGIAAGPDGLYFSGLYKDAGANSPIDPGAAIYRVRWVGFSDFEVRYASVDGLTIDLADRSRVADAWSWEWDFGDGTTSRERGARHRYEVEGTYIVRLRVNGIAAARKIRAGTDAAVLTVELFGLPDFTEPLDVREADTVDLVPGGAVEAAAVRWRGTLVPRFSERYRFESVATGSSRVTVAGRRVIDEDHVAGEIDLESGRPVEVLVETWNEAGAAAMQLFWQSPNQRRLLVPRSLSLPRRRAAR